MNERGDNASSDAAIEQLAQGMRRVTNGQFDTQLNSWPDEPFRSIFADFNQMTESLLDNEAMRESFVSNVAHEFKTPLAYIQGYATLLQEENLPEAKRTAYVKNINNAIRRLSNMIGDLLEISNLSRPTAEMETAVFSLDEQLRHALAIFIPQIERKSMTYDIELEAVDIDGNESLLENVWVNLLSNTLKYTPEGGAVSVSLEQHDEMAIVAIADTGCGMTENQARHAFDRFYQGEYSHVTEGNGLGLAVVKAVVKKHGGTVSVSSKLYEGTTFTVTLPLAPIGMPSAQRSETNRAEQ